MKALTAEEIAKEYAYEKYPKLPDYNVRALSDIRAISIDGFESGYAAAWKEANEKWAQLSEIIQLKPTKEIFNPCLHFESILNRIYPTCQLDIPGTELGLIKQAAKEYAESVHASWKEEWIETIKNAAFALCWLSENTIPTDANLQSDFYNITMNTLTGLNDLIPNAPSEKIDENQLPF